MHARLPLLAFIEHVESPDSLFPEGTYYNCDLGYWILPDNKPLIELIIHSEGKPIVGQTTKTASREGIDQSEGISSQTSITRSRESVDQSESVVPIYAQTTITETREGIDRSERAA
jgi:hypothetical protein